MPSRLLRLPPRCVISLHRRVEPRGKARPIRIVRAFDPEKTSSTSTLTSPSSPPPPPRFSFAPLDAYDATRALLLSLAATSVGSLGAGVGSLASWLVGEASISLADARALSAFIVEGSQLAAVSLVVAKAGNDFLSFDFFRDRQKTIATGLVGGLAAVAAVAGVDSFLSSFFLSFSSSSATTETATGVAASVLSGASGPLFRAALLSASCVFAPITEEIVFRGILLRGLLLGRSGSGSSKSSSCSSSSSSSSSSSLVVAVAASAAAFAATHLFVLASDGGGDRSGETAKELLLLFVLGLVLGATAVVSNGRGRGEEEREGQESERSGRRSDESNESGGDSPFNLAAPALAHAVYNAVAYCVAVSASG